MVLGIDPALLLPGGTRIEAEGASNGNRFS
jgi:hypothetical protein